MLLLAAAGVVGAAGPALAQQPSTQWKYGMPTDSGAPQPMQQPRTQWKYGIASDTGTDPSYYPAPHEQWQYGMSDGPGSAPRTGPAQQSGMPAGAHAQAQ
jgi:hypothetical protein